jgi:branched-chain amino acid transport system permease protein
MNAATIGAARSRRQEPSPLRRALVVGLVFGVIAVYITVVGILPLIDARWIVVGVLSLGDAALITIGLGAGAVIAARRRSAEFRPLALPSFLAGGVAGSLLALLALAVQVFNLRPIFIALSPALLKTLTFGLGMPLGPAVLILGGALLAVLGAALTLAPASVRRPVVIGLSAVLVFGAFQELIQIMMQYGEIIGALREAIFTWEGLTAQGAVAIFVLACGGALLWTKALRGPIHDRFARFTATQQRRARAARIVFFVLLLVLLPIVAGAYIS